MMSFIVRIMLFIVVEVAGDSGGDRMGASPELRVSKEKNGSILQFWVAKAAKPWAQAILIQTQQGRTRMGGLFLVVFRCFPGVWRIWWEDVAWRHQAPVGPGSHGSGQASLLLSLLFSPEASAPAWLWAELLLLGFVSSQQGSEKRGAGQGHRCGCRVRAIPAAEGRFAATGKERCLRCLAQPSLLREA